MVNKQKNLKQIRVGSFDLSVETCTIILYLNIYLAKFYGNISLPKTVDN